MTKPPNTKMSLCISDDYKLDYDADGYPELRLPPPSMTAISYPTETKELTKRFASTLTREEIYAAVFNRLCRRTRPAGRRVRADTCFGTLLPSPLLPSPPSSQLPPPSSPLPLRVLASASGRSGPLYFKAQWKDAKEPDCSGPLIARHDRRSDWVGCFRSRWQDSVCSWRFSLGRRISAYPSTADVFTVGVDIC